MRTVIIIVIGLVFFGVCLLASRWLGNVATAPAMAARIFIPLWLLAAACNMWMGVARAGYSVAEELPIFLLIFAVPAAVAALVWWKQA
jgi:hypothetical protein